MTGSLIIKGERRAARKTIRKVRPTDPDGIARLKKRGWRTISVTAAGRI